VHQLDIKVLNIIDARCNHEVHLLVNVKNFKEGLFVVIIEITQLWMTATRQDGDYIESW